MLAALPYPPETSRWLLGGLLAVLLWYLMLPVWFYHTSAVYIEGPLPAFAGAAFGLWLHQADAPRLQALGACGWAIATEIAAVVVFGTLAFGPFSAIAGLYGLFRDVFHLPFLDVPRAIGSGYFPYVFWEGVKTLLAWGAIAYVVLLFTKFDLKSRFRGVVADRSVNRTFTAEQKKLSAEYRRRYVEAVKAGEPPPAAPAGLMPPGMITAGGAGWHSHAKVAYWAVRIGIAVAGLLGAWTAIKSQMFGLGGQIFLRGLFGGG